MGILYIVATPIGNLGDITYRAVDILKEVDLILCEDTRHAKKLLSHYGIQTGTKSFHQHSGGSKVDSIIKDLEKGSHVALISDAGTPGISDPGVALVARIYERLGEHAQVISVPGACAFVAALSISGVPTQEFCFLGFVPHKKGRMTFFRRVAEASETVVFYESVHRIEKALESLDFVLGERKTVVLARELTKQFETLYRGTAESVLVQLRADAIKGEFVVIVAP